MKGWRIMPATIEKQEAATAMPERMDNGPRYTPLVDIVETNDGYTFYADLPGVKAGDLDITYEDDALAIEAMVVPRQPADQQYLVQEYGVGSFSRSFRIATPVEPDGIRAELKNGELSLFVPKAESAKVRKIEINTP